MPNMTFSIARPVVLFVAFAGVTAMASANDISLKRCRVFNWKPGDIIPVEAAMYKTTHITLPEEALDVVWGTKELWENDHIKNHVFVKPTSPTPQGKATTATAVGSSGNTYEFEIERVDKLQSSCITVEAKGALINRANWDTRENMQEAQIKLLQQQLARANTEKAQAATQAAEEAKRQSAEAVKTYRSTISSNYEWTKGEGWFADSAIESVHDDGRFTYIRLKSDNKGIMSVLAEIDGSLEVLEKVYDATKREYRIAGIYPKFILRAQNSEVTVTRRK